MLISCSAAQEPAAQIVCGSQTRELSSGNSQLSKGSGGKPLAHQRCASKGLLQAYFETGRYREAEEAVKKYLVVLLL